MSEKAENTGEKQHEFVIALLSGACAGLLVDLILFPLDTLKTRLQSQYGFRQTGGFKKLYRGLGSAMIVSAPNAATFFSVYESVRSRLISSHVDPENQVFANMLAASCGETAACTIRVPVETIKQRTQASKLSSRLIIKETIFKEGFAGLYRGFLSTVARDVPFALIQLPLWEYTKISVQKWKGKQLDVWESSLCGSFAGFTAAIFTNPIDVAKTRIMLSRSDPIYTRINFFRVIAHVFRKSGIRGLYAGATPRVLFITIGGAIYLGGYDLVAKRLKLLIN